MGGGNTLYANYLTPQENTHIAFQTTGNHREGSHLMEPKFLIAIC